MKMHPISCFCASALALAPSIRHPLSAAEVFQVTHETRSELPSGKEADGMVGDWIIRNDLVTAVIGQTSQWRDANQMVEGVQGAVIDFTTRADNNDQLVVLYPQGYRPTGVSANRAGIMRSGGATAELIVVRDPTDKEPYRSSTTYSLSDGNSWLHIRTTHENTSGHTVSLAVHDWLRLDNDIACQQAQGDQDVIGMASPWFHAAYGLSGSDGRAQRAKQDLDHKNLRSIGTLVHYPSVNPRQQPTLALEPGGKIEIERNLFVARDLAGVQFAAASAHGRKADPVLVTVKEADGAPIQDAMAAVCQEGKLASTSLSDRNGRLAFPLADGEYKLIVEQAGRADFQQPLIIEHGVPRGEATLRLPPQSLVSLDISEAGTGERMPVKIEFRGRNGTPNPNLGPPKRANGAGSLFFSARGDDTFPAPAGEYDVHVSRGPEYEAVVRPVSIPVGGTVRLSVQLHREYSTPHWIIADLHNHSTGSGDSAVEFSGRVLNLAGSGIEFAPATEHNRISTYSPTIEALGIRQYIASAASMELSGRPGPGSINHQIAFPLEIHEDQQGFGAPRTDANPFVQMTRLFELDHRSPKLMQQNHPDIGWLYFDRDRDGALDGGFGTRPITDVMEIRETIHSLLADTAPGAKGRRSRAFHWLQMLNQGDRIFGTANTDAHTVGHASGSIFNFIHVQNDDIARLDPWDVARAAKQGHIVMSNGPFLDVSIDGAIPGDSITMPGGRILLKVRVLQASWAHIDRVQILVNGRQVPDGNLTRQRNTKDFLDGVIQFDRAIPLTLSQDAHIIVIATGETATVGRVLGGQFAKLHPIAVSNPIFVDVDGNGFSPSRDLLDAPLPDGKPRPGGRKTEDD